MRTRFPLLAALLLVLAACTTSDGGATAASSASAEVSGDDVVIIAGFAYDPTELTVSVGDAVRFVNEDTAPHTVTQGEDGTAAEDAAFDEQLASGESVEITFDTAGDVTITCRFHSTMNMVVHVE